MTISTPYRAPIATIIFMIVFFLGCSAAMFAAGVQQHEGGQLFGGGVTWGPEGSRNIFFAFGVVCIGLAIWGVAQGYARKKFNHHVTLDDNGLELPKSLLSPDHLRIAFADITDVNMTVVKGNRFCIVKHRGGKVALNAQRFENRSAYEQIGEALKQRMPRP